MVFELVGAGNIALVTDSMAATGLPDGDYALGPSEVVVHDGVATLKATAPWPAARRPCWRLSAPPLPPG